MLQNTIQYYFMFNKSMSLFRNIQNILKKLKLASKKYNVIQKPYNLYSLKLRKMTRQFIKNKFFLAISEEINMTVWNFN